ncbi:uncharacterized protein LOC103982148 isoform X2 [Musa acuminata AAA Group]|uniref:uncharacterized protein LOC103982148 isoform X2 n=1 Tax=Musa acuminata AAA Group TaxID=214697 RepID=UPI0031D30FFF
MDKQTNHKRVESGGSIFRRLICKQATEDASSNEDKVPCNTPRRSVGSRTDSSFEGMASGSSVNGDNLMSSGRYVRDHGSLLSLQPWIFRKGNYSTGEETGKANGKCSENCRYDMDGFMYNSSAEFSPLSVSLGHSCGRGRSSLRTRRPRQHSIKPLSSLENCLVPQIYSENFEFEEFVFSSFPSPAAPALRPFVITDGSKIISKSSFGDMDIPFGNGIQERNMKRVMGVSSLPEPRTPKRKSRETPDEKLESFNSQRSCRGCHQKVFPGSLDGMHIFSVGVSLGFVSAILSNRKEIEKLNNMLKSSENLVQDLEEELEMKESIIVKELADEACGCQEPSDIIAEIETTESSRIQVSSSYFLTQNNEHNLLLLPKEDSRSKIEAELEIELERLELNIASSLNGEMSTFNEIDPDLIADVVHGDLKADLLPGGASEEYADNASDSKSASTNYTNNFNYAVSPRELSLRLYEVIQHRLEERIKELEIELQKTQKQLQLVESEHVSRRAFSSSDMGSSSNQDSPMDLTADTAFSRPFCLNLAGDALDAYDEAYEEFMRVATTEEKLPSTTNSDNELQYGLPSSDRSLIWGMEGPKYRGSEPTWEQNLKKREPDVTHEIYTAYEDDDDDEMKTLIEQIMERTRQGSTIVVNAQRMLFSMDD